MPYQLAVLVLWPSSLMKEVVFKQVVLVKVKQLSGICVIFSTVKPVLWHEISNE